MSKFKNKKEMNSIDVSVAMGWTKYKDHDMVHLRYGGKQWHAGAKLTAYPLND